MFHAINCSFRKLGLPLILLGLLTRVALADVPAPKLLSVKKIWDRAPHNAFTDLIEWRGRLYCAFREGKAHAGDRGHLRVIVSTDGETWASAALLTDAKFDLRDASLSETPDGRLMVLGGAQAVEQGVRRTGTFVSFSENGRDFTTPEIVVKPGRWLWRVTWRGNTAYGVAYGAPNQSESSSLLQSKDGQSYEATNEQLFHGGRPTEARIRFAKDGTGYCLHRRDGAEQNSAQLGVANPPYTSWQWRDLHLRLGGPNLIQLPSGHWVAAGRLYDQEQRTELLNLDVDQGVMTPILRLPSGGDTSYPGMVWHDGALWVSYYSSHEGRACIYLAKVRFEEERQGAKRSEPVSIGRRRELFVDRALIDQLNDTELRMHTPVAAETVLRFDRPWEGPFCGYATVFKDDRRFRMYYRGLPKARADGTDSEVTCYAESEDGVRWVKPNLGLYEIHGTRENNVVLAGQAPASHNFSPFLDTNPKAPTEARYKALGGGASGLIAFQSADGLHWNRLQQDPVFTKGVFDSQNVAFWSKAEQMYVCYFRTWTQSGYQGFRTVSRTTSLDFRNWTEPVAMTFGNRPHEHLYTNQTAPYFRAPHIYIAIAARFMPGRKVLSSQDAERLSVNPDYFGDCSDAVLLSSRGLNRYDRTFMESYIRPGIGLENWVSRTNYPALGVVPTSDTEMSIYLQKNYGQPTARLQRYRTRIDGFASVHAGFDVGEMLTKPIRLPVAEQVGLQLTLNCSTSAAGEIKVELQDEQGQAISGFSLEDADAIVGDDIERVVSWNGVTDMSPLAGRTARIRFWMKDADLYSIRLK